MIRLECKINVHKRCQKNVAFNCGINPKQVALLLQQLGISDTANQTGGKTNKTARDTRQQVRCCCLVA